MKESVGYTVTLNIVITFIIIVFAFLSAALIYFKSNKVSNVITETIQKYEGYNTLAQNEIEMKLSSIGYNRKSVNCKKYYNRIGENERTNCSDSLSTGVDGYCIFVCDELYNGEPYYYYKISTNLMLNIPIINDLLDVPIFSNTSRLYDFSIITSGEDEKLKEDEFSYDKDPEKVVDDEGLEEGLDDEI